MDQAIIPECYVDTNLTETLVPPGSEYNHQHGCGTVTKVMKEKFADRFALGIIDKDKKTIDYLKEFDVVCQTESLYLHKHKTKHHYIIQISPAMERFILKSAEVAGVRMDEFDLPSDLDALKKITKKINSKDNDRLKRLFKRIRKNGCPEFEKMAGWISYLRAHPYDVDVEQLKAI